MISIDSMYMKDNGSTAHYPQRRKKLPRACGQIDVNALRKEMPISQKMRSKQRVKSFLNEVKQRTVSLTDEEFARLERMIMERRGRAAAHVDVAPIGTVQPPNQQSRCSENIIQCTCLYGGKHRGKDGPGARRARTIIGWYEF